MKKWLLGLMLVATQAHAEFWSGNTLLTKMNSSETMDRMSAIHYVVGVADSLERVIWCPNTTELLVGQIYDLSYRFLVANPQHRHLAANKSVAWALAEVWPCPTKGVDKGRTL